MKADANNVIYNIVPNVIIIQMVKIFVIDAIMGIMLILEELAVNVIQVILIKVNVMYVGSK